MREKANETTLSNRINELMMNQGIRNADLAKALYVTSSAVSGYRTGYRCPDIEKIYRMAEYLDVSVAYLLGYSEDPASDRFDAVAGAEGYFALFCALSEKNRKIAIEHMTELLVKQMQNFAKSDRND